MPGVLAALLLAFLSNLFGSITHYGSGQVSAAVKHPECLEMRRGPLIPQLPILDLRMSGAWSAEHLLGRSNAERTTNKNGSSLRHATETW